MNLTSEMNHKKRLSDCNIDIKTIYSKGIRTEKDYYFKNKLIKKLYGLDPRIEYAYIKDKKEGTDFICSNCGMGTHITSKIDACPFCGTELDLTYKNNNMSSKFTFDLAMVNKKYILFSFLASIIIAIIISLLFYYYTGQTYNMHDVSKTVIVGLASAAVLFFTIYIVTSFIVLIPINMKRDKINKHDEKVWKDLDNRGVSYITFYNNLHYELDKYYYLESKSDIIDYDVIDYYNFKLVEDASSIYLKMTMVIREVYLEKGKIKHNQKTVTTTFKKSNKPIKTDGGVAKKVSCHNCGATMSVTSDKCDYCDTPNNYNQEWYLSKIN